MKTILLNIRSVCRHDLLSDLNSCGAEMMQGIKLRLLRSSQWRIII